MSLCKDCISGVRHEGVPEGKIEKIRGVECYVATPAVDYAKDKVILFLPDAFGIPLVNNRLLADDFSRNGFKVVIPDIFAGDPVPDDAFNSGNFDLGGWFSRHSAESWQNVVDTVVAALKEQGVTRFGTTGYCFGAQPAFYLAFKNESHVTVVAHPTALKAPEDFEKYKAVSKAPLLINSCETDPQFPKESQAIADEILGGGKFTPGYERKYWDGCTHGFAIRGDLSDPKVKAGKEEAFTATVEAFQKYL